MFPLELDLEARVIREKRVGLMAWHTNPAAALVIRPAATPVRQAGLCAGLGLRCKPETRQRHAGEADAEFLQRRTARDRLSQALC